LLTQLSSDPVLLEKITKSLNITVPARIARAQDPRLLMTTIFSSWLPLSTALLVSVVESLPSPKVAQGERLPDLLDDSPGSENIDPMVKDAMINFRASKSDPVVAYVSKMVSIPESELPENKRRGVDQLSAEEARELARRKRAEFAQAQKAESGFQADMVAGLNEVSLDDFVPEVEEKEIEAEHLIGFARIYSGTLSVGDSLYVLPPKFTPANPHAAPEPRKVTVTSLYMLMGRNLESLDSVPAGVVFGIGGLEGHILKSGTLCSQLEGAVNLAGVSMVGKPIVRVALEPVNPADLDKMIHGLKLLVQSDPCAEYEQFQSGEHVLLTAGELHLERCLTDLKERFARCEVQAGAPIVPYRETIVRAEEMRPPANKELGRGVVVGVTSSKQVSVTVRVRPLPQNVTEFLLKNATSVKRAYSEQHGVEENGNNHELEDQQAVGVDEDVVETKALSIDELKKQLQEVLEGGKGREAWKDVIDKIVAFGPRRIGPNLLIDATKEGLFPKVFSGEKVEGDTPQAGEALHASHLCDKVTYAFQLAMSQGPLCHEPVQGVGVVIEDVSVSAAEEDAPARDRLGRLTGETIKTVQQAIRQGFLDWSPRLMLAMYSCEIQASSESLLSPFTEP
jgi:ribosome assembly protein 1